MRAQHLKTWVEINKKSIEHNAKIMRGILAPKTKLWSVVKSNAYGHGLVAFAQIAAPSVDGFCVDSVPEGLKLRQNDLKKPILVLGPTLPSLIGVAAENSIILSISNFESLKNLSTAKSKPKFHLKIDTGMHRQGFNVSELPKVIKILKTSAQGGSASGGKSSMPNGRQAQLTANATGIYTHFASAKDINYPTYTDMQFSAFQKAISILEKAGFKNLMTHAAATGGTLVNPKYHLDAVRVGIGLYGLWPSKELQIQKKNIKFKPVLSWHALVSEIKTLKKWDYVGYDLVERVSEPTKIAIVPIGYWHGFPRALSGTGEVLIKGKRARVLGRVSMDLLIVNVNGIAVAVGDKATIIGRQKKSELNAFDVAQKCGTVHYELITRINPLIERTVK